MSGLTSKQEAFAVAVAKGSSASDAYRAAYDAGKMSPETLHKRASELQNHGGVAGRIAALRAPALEASSASVERTMREVTGLAYVNPDAQGVKVKYSEKLAALEMLMKHHGLYKNDNAQKAPNVAIQVVLE